MIGYYYCSLKTFLNIIKNKKIYLSDPLKMNDDLEIKLYLNKLNSNIIFRIKIIYGYDENVFKLRLYII